MYQERSTKQFQPLCPVKHMHACLSVRNNLDSSLHHCGGPVKHVQASLSARKDREISFDRCGGPM